MKSKYAKTLELFEAYKKEANKYWVTLQPREQQLLAGGSIILVLLAVFWLIGSAIDMQSNLNTSVLKLSQGAIVATSINKEYKDLDSISANSVNQVKNDQVRDDVSSALDTKMVDVLLQDGILTINVGEAEFSRVIILLDQLRNSYGLFPATVKINRLSQPGHIAFNATFMVNQ